ncbi:MAG: hypothetical protein V4594_25205 [Bacteroidota bacterium]
MKPEPQIVLGLPLKELNIGEKFLLPAERMGFKNLQDIIDTPMSEIMEYKHFSYVWLHELMNVLDQHDLLHLLDK